MFPGSTPECAAPCRREVDTMTFTLAVLKETLRKYSVVPVVTRHLAKDDELLGHKLPAGIMVACVLQVCACWVCGWAWWCVSVWAQG